MNDGICFSFRPLYASDFTVQSLVLPWHLCNRTTGYMAWISKLEGKACELFYKVEDLIL